MRPWISKKATNVNLPPWQKYPGEGVLRPVIILIKANYPPWSLRWLGGQEDCGNFSEIRGDEWRCLFDEGVLFARKRERERSSAIFFCVVFGERIVKPSVVLSQSRTLCKEKKKIRVDAETRTIDASNERTSKIKPSTPKVYRLEGASTLTERRRLSKTSDRKVSTMVKRRGTVFPSVGSSLRRWARHLSY